MTKVSDESLLEIERVKSIIIYDVSKTATENFFVEQKPDFSGYDILNPMNPNYGKKTEDPLGLKNWDTHDWFTLVQLTLLVLGFATGGITSIVAFALGSIVDVAEAGIFLVKDKDPYMATVMLILSILGVNDLMKLPIVKKYGVKGTKELMKRAKDGVKLSVEEIRDLKKLGEQIAKNSGEIIPLFKKGLKRKILNYLSKKNTKQLLNLLVVLNKSKVPLFIAGTWIPFDYVYIYVFRDDIEKMKLRNENAFLQIINWVESKLGGKEITSEMLLPSFQDIDINEFPSVQNDSLSNVVVQQMIKKYDK